MYSLIFSVIGVGLSGVIPAEEPAPVLPNAAAAAASAARLLQQTAA